MSKCLSFARTSVERYPARRKLERQRKKDLRLVKNALRQEQERRERAVGEDERLEVERGKREERDAWFEKGRRLLLDELEEESVDWLATEEEVDHAFGVIRPHLVAVPR